AAPSILGAAREVVAEQRRAVLVYADLRMDRLAYTLAFPRLAPVQCVTWGHPVTSGIPTVDYFVSSTLFESEDADAHYTEKLVRLDSLPFYAYRPALPERFKARADLGLPTDMHIYACPQSLF